VNEKRYGDEPRIIIEELRNLRALTDVLSWVASRFDKAVDLIEAQAPLDDIIRELQDYLVKSNERIDKSLLLILERLPDNANVSQHSRRVTNQLRLDTLSARIESLKKQASILHTNLNDLEEQAAMFGFGQVPVHLRNQMNGNREQLANVAEELEFYEDEYAKTVEALK
jgi:hypothetical protein